MHLSVDVRTWRISRLIAKQTVLIGENYIMFWTITNITETAGTISHADYLSALDLSSKVALVNVNYRLPYLVVDLAVASPCHAM